MPAADPTPPLTQQLRALETVPDSYITLSPELVILTASHACLAAPPVALGTIVDDLRQDLLPALAQTGGQLEVDAEAYPVLGIAAKNLRSLLYNLLSNALKYHPPPVRRTCA